MSGFNQFARSAWARLSVKSQARSACEPGTAKKKKKTISTKVIRHPSNTLKRRSLYAKHYGNPAAAVDLMSFSSPQPSFCAERQQAVVTSARNSANHFCPISEARDDSQPLLPPLPPPRPSKRLFRNSLDSYSEELNQIFSVLDQHVEEADNTQQGSASEPKNPASFESLVVEGRMRQAEETMSSLISRLRSAEQGLAEVGETLKSLRTASQIDSKRLESLETELANGRVGASTFSRLKDDFAEPLRNFCFGLNSAVDLFYESCMALLITWFSMLLVAKLLCL